MFIHNAGICCSDFPQVSCCAISSRSKRLFYGKWEKEVKKERVIWSLLSIFSNYQPSHAFSPFFMQKIAHLITHPLYLPLRLCPSFPRFFPYHIFTPWNTPPHPFLHTLLTTSPPVYLYPSYSNLSVSPVSSHSDARGIQSGIRPYWGKVRGLMCVSVCFMCV